MPLKVGRNNITKVKADVIVNTANPNPICASGTDLAIYEAAGKEKLLYIFLSCFGHTEKEQQDDRNRRNM